MIFAFDLVAWLFLPPHKTLGLRGYRMKPEYADVQWPGDYYVANESQGFDIGPNRATRHQVEGYTYPVWSNSLGCFDREHASYADYVYFAGDSYTWGYAPYESKFGTLIEQRTGRQILKCAVEHTGQRHQFAKFTGIVDRIRSMPKAVFVFYYWNDVANDYLHPHSTVIDGLLVDAVAWKSWLEFVPVPRTELERKAADQNKWARIARERRQRESARPGARLKAAVRQYSITANLVNATGEWISARRSGSWKRSNPVPRKNLYNWPGGTESFRYLHDPRAKANMAAWLAFKSWSDANKVRLIAVLVPRPRPGRGLGGIDLFLRQNGIEYFDLEPAFKARGADHALLYWKGDGHLNFEGNQLVAEILVAEFPEVFAQQARQARVE